MAVSCKRNVEVVKRKELECIFSLTPPACLFIDFTEDQELFVSRIFYRNRICRLTDACVVPPVPISREDV